MKKITLILTVVAVITLNFKIYAQEEVPKELLLSSLNSVAHLKLENDQITQLMDYNKGLVDVEIKGAVQKNQEKRGFVPWVTKKKEGEKIINKDLDKEHYLGRKSR